MEKIWIKKELYYLRYDFLKFLCLFSNLMRFYIWFLEVFSIKKREKKGFTNLQADVASGSWRGARDQLGLRRGTEATWQRPGSRAGGALGAPSGRMTRGHPCGLPRTGSVIEGIEIINRGIHSPVYTQYFPLFAPCGTMFPHGLTLQVTWTRGECPISSRTATIAWTRVHAIIDQTRA